MKLKEFFKNNKAFASNLGTNKFNLSLNKKYTKTPHYVMNKVLEILETRPSITSGLKMYTKFLISNMSIESNDDKSKVFLEEWFNQRKNIKQTIYEWAFLLNGCGTSYLEPLYNQTKNGKVLDNLFNVPDPSTIYKNVNAKSDDEYWVIELPVEVRAYNNIKLQYIPVQYVHQSYLFRKLVWGTYYPKNKLIQSKIGWSRTNDYGYGLISPAVDNQDILKEIVKNWAMIAKFRSLSKKIIGFYNDNGESVDMSELDRIREEFDSMEEEDSLLINKKFVSEDLTFNGNDNMMNNEIEYLHKDSGSSLVPNYMTAFSQDSSLATASEAKVPFALELKSTQKILENYLNEIIVDNLRSNYSWLSDDLRIVLKEVNLYSRDEEFNNIFQLYNVRAATFNELRSSAGLQTVENGDTWGSEPPLDNTSTTVKKDTMKESFMKEFKNNNIVLKPSNKNINNIYEFKETNNKKGFLSAVKEVIGRR